MRQSAIAVDDAIDAIAVVAAGHLRVKLHKPKQQRLQRHGAPRQRFASVHERDNCAVDPRKATIARAQMDQVELVAQGRLKLQHARHSPIAAVKHDASADAV